MMKLLTKIFLIFILVLSLPACDFAITQEQRIKKQVKEYLNDPDSAKFESIHQGKEEKYFCGLVNAKNRMGGYVGLRPFVYEKVTNDFAMVTFVSDTPKDSDFRMLKGSLSFKERHSTLYDECRSIRIWNTACGINEIDFPEMCRLMLDGKPREFIDKLYKDY
jgi:hypothetical protein